ncbi:hypothetical protein [Cellulomonas sp. NPDC089187]|uniref:hypothetical protein n=1 Tax=Cellulomonas sp. NPDC089187 TaxID=3154970 RepID=UPI00342FCEE9
MPPVRWDTDPRLILGWREKGSIRAGRVPLHKGVVNDIRDIARGAMARLVDGESRQYEPSASLTTREEFFRIPVDGLPARKPKRGQVDGTADSAAMLSATAEPDLLDKIPPVDLSDHSAFVFYGLVFDLQGGGTVTFVTKDDPVRAAAGFKVSLFGADKLKLATPPLVSLRAHVDLVIGAQEVFVLRKAAFEQLFNDVKVALADAPANIEEVADTLEDLIVLGPDAVASLQAVATKRISYAVRLRALSERIAQIKPTPASVRQQLKEMGNDPADLLEGDTFVFDESNVGLFLDLMEGRHFADQWTGERMRADRMSRHQPGA